MKRKQKQLSATLESKLKPDIDDFLILEQLRQEERDLADFVQKCIVIDPESRLTCEEALRHPFIIS